jgi:hypothetical protein
MKHEATLIYTEQLIRTAVLAFWRRTVGVGFVFAIAAVAGGLVAFLWFGVTSWVVGALATVLVFAVAFAVTLYVVHYRNAITKLRQMPSFRATFVAEEWQFSVTSELGSSTLPWSSVQDLWRFERCWLLLFSKAQFITLPLECLPTEMQSFILQRMQAAGSKNAA